jgi:hypothetical protein
MAVGHIYIAGYKVAGNVAPQPHLTSWYLDSSNFPFNCFVVHKIIDINLDPIKSYTAEVTNNIYYFSRLATKQVLVEEDIDIHRYKEIIKFSLIFIEDI